MKSFFNRNEEAEEVFETEDDMDIINLDETAGWSKLEVVEELAKQQAANLMEEIGDELAIMDAMEEDVRIEELQPVKKVKKSTHAVPVKNKKNIVELKELSEADLEIEQLQDEDIEIEHLQDHDIKMEPLQDDDIEYITEEDDDPFEEDSPFAFFEGVTAWFSHWTVLDKVVAVTGVLVLAAAIATVGVYAGSRSMNQQLEAFAPVGEQLETIGITGQDKLLAVADAKKAMMEAAKLEEELNQVYEENELSSEVKVIMKMTSVQKDLKIKFINKKSGKLIGNVPFEVKIVDSNNKTYNKIDEDMDGIIYLSNITPGDYSVSMEELADAEEYSFSTAAEKIKVKENIEYKKIDVTEEIKDQSEVDVSKEDTAQKTETEAALKDTVEWVESTKKESDSETEETYIEVNKDTIQDPALSASLNLDVSILRVMQQSMLATSSISDNNIGTGKPEAAITKIELDKSTLELKVGESASLTATVSADKEVDKSVTWKSNNTSVATVENGIVTAVAEGETQIIALAGNKTAICVVKVSKVNDVKNDTTTLLKDKSGNQVYVLVDGQYVEAKAADYYIHSTFYIKEKAAQVIYSGWQNIDGKTYYYDKNGNKVTGEQVIQGAKYNFNSDGTLNTGSGTLGIDVSTWNGNIDWSKVKNSGVSYVIIRTGFRGSTQGALVEDNKFRQNIQGATNAGLKVGVYFFSQAINEVEAVEEASMVLSQIKGYKLAYPVFIDVEPSGGRADSLSSGDRTKVINAFCQTIQNGGYSAGIYANKTWLSQKMNVSALSGYKIWLAQYNTTVTYGGRYDMWQYSEKGKISGISGNVDMNLSYLNY